MAKKKEVKEEVKKENKEPIKEEELFIPKTKHKFLKILLAILLIAGIITGGYFLYQEKFNNPKNIVKNILERDDSEQSNLLINEDGIFKINGLVKIKANLGEKNKEITDVLNNIDLQFSGEVDTKESIANLDINTKYQNEKLIDLKAYLENNNYYILLDEIFDKYIKIDNKESEEDLKEIVKSIKLNSKDINTLTTGLKNAFKEEIIKFDFKKESDSISIDGKTINVYNNYVILKNNEVNTFASALLNNLANNTEVCNLIKSWTEQDGKVVLTLLASEMNNIPFTGTYRINFYTDKGIFNKNLVSIRQEITQSGITMIINTDKIEDGMIMSFSTIGMSYTVKITRNSSNYNLNITISSLDQYANVDVSVNYEKINELTKPDVSKSKKIEDLTDAEKKQIEEGFTQKEALKALFKKIQDSVPELKA